MIIDTNNYFNTPVRTVNARVELYENSALADAYNKYYALKSFSIERVGESKFFGFGICQKLNVHLVDKDRAIYITTIDSFKPYLSTGENYITSFPEFFVTEVHRDENTNELSITAYDAIYKGNTRYFGELALTAPYTIADVAAACAEMLGLTGLVTTTAADSFNLEYPEGANFEGSETIRQTLDAIAEATQTIYYIDSNSKLVFKRLDMSGNPVLQIGKADYITLDSGTNRRLATIVHATELGDNVSVSTSATGSTQYVRDNPFWDLREDIDTLLNDALDNVGGLTVNQFNCEWRGNPALEIGDKISLTAKDGNTVVSYLLDDVISYDGGLKQNSGWSFEDNENESADNPATLGDALKQTYARVDKVNKQIDLVASDVSANSEAISSLQINTESISASVSNTETKVNESLEEINGEIVTLTEKVEAQITAEDVTIAIQTELDNGVEKVTTSTGFTFNEVGLTVSKSGSEMETTITENGMTVYRDGQAVLIADHEGVKAEDLHATTYLIIGNNSRFEDYNGNRTACFWIGG